jgi:hypothetical protein
MNFQCWKQGVWPSLPEEKKEELLAEMRRLRKEGWGMQDAWIQVACTV